MSGELRYGYDLATLEHLAKVACARAFSHALNYDDRREAARFGVVEHLYAAEAPPRPEDLIGAGIRAILQESRAHTQAHGIRGDGTIHDAFARYWSQRVSHSPEDMVVDRMALRQILPTLTQPTLQAVYALAHHGDHQQAADALGLHPMAYASRLTRARQRFFHYWHQGERPPRRPRDKRVWKRAA